MVSASNDNFAGGKKMEDSNHGIGYGEITIQQAFEKSSNVIAQITNKAYRSEPERFIKRLEQLYTPKVIVKYLKNTKENISNKVCISVAKRYKVEPFLRYSL
jgi:hypothetical protein